MRPLQITLFIIGLTLLGTQTFRHVYARWIAPTDSVLDEFRDPVEADIAHSEDLDELVALYAEAHGRVQEHERLTPRDSRARTDQEPYLSESRVRMAINRWESQSRSIFELHFYWLAGLVSILGGLVTYRRINRWLGMVGIIAGFSEMAWWTSPLVRTRGPQLQIEQLLDRKLLLSVISVVLLVGLWLLAERRGRREQPDP